MPQPPQSLPQPSQSLTQPSQSLPQCPHGLTQLPQSLTQSSQSLTQCPHGLTQRLPTSTVERTFFLQRASFQKIHLTARLKQNSLRFLESECKEMYFPEK